MNDNITINQIKAHLMGSREMKMTKHAKMRIRQRGFSNSVLNIILNHGRYKEVSGGAIQIYFGNKEYQNIISELKRGIQLLDKAKGGSVIVAEDKIITLYKG